MVGPSEGGEAIITCLVSEEAGGGEAGAVSVRLPHRSPWRRAEKSCGQTLVCCLQLKVFQGQVTTDPAPLLLLT